VKKLCEAKRRIWSTEKDRHHDGTVEDGAGDAAIGS